MKHFHKRYGMVITDAVEGALLFDRRIWNRLYIHWHLKVSGSLAFSNVLIAEPSVVSIAFAASINPCCCVDKHSV